MEKVRVTVRSLDAITSAGLTTCLDSLPDVIVTDGEADVVIAGFDRLSAAAVTLLRTAAADVRRPIVLVVNEIREAELLPAVECRVVSILPRAAAADDRLAKAVRPAATGGAELPPNLLGQLVGHAEKLHNEVLAAHGLTASGLSPREVDVLRLMADGLDTNEIAKNLSYSERTVKNIIYTITSRLRLRNRPHAVAYAMRAGIISGRLPDQVAGRKVGPPRRQRRRKQANPPDWQNRAQCLAALGQAAPPHTVARSTSRQPKPTRRTTPRGQEAGSPNQIAAQRRAAKKQSIPTNPLAKPPQTPAGQEAGNLTPLTCQAAANATRSTSRHPQPTHFTTHRT